MNKVTTNRIAPTVNFQNIIEDFVVVQFTQSDGYIKFGAQFIDEFSQNVMAKAVVFENGSSLYTLFVKTEFENIDLRKVLDEGTEMDGLHYKVLDIEQLQNVPRHILIQLLINSLNAPKSERLQFNNLTGKLFLFKESLFEKRKFGKNKLLTKIPAVEVKINKDLQLQLRTTTFTSLLLLSRLKFERKQLKDYAKYTYVHATKSMRRILKSENLDAKDVFIIKQEQGKKTVTPFMDFSDLDSFSESKMGQLSFIFDKIKSKLSNYIQVSFEIKETEKSIRLKGNGQDDINTILAKEKLNLNIINSLEEEGLDYAETLKEMLKSLFPQNVVSISNNYKPKALNIKLLHNKAYYENHGTKDTYSNTGGIVQHITIEDFNFKSSSAVKAIVKELLIKRDVHLNQVSLVDWANYNYQLNQIFGISRNDSYYFLTIAPNGSMSFERKEPSLFNQSEFDDLITIFSDDKSVEGIIKNDKGDINIIRRSDLFTLPEFQNIYKKLLAEDKDEEFNVEDLLMWLSEIDIEPSQNNHFSSLLEEHSKNTILKSEILRLIDHRSVKKKLAKHIEDKTGKVLKVYMRDQSKYDLMDSNLDIHSYIENGKLFYYVGTIGDGMRTKIGRASVIREISGFLDGPIFFDKMLPLMNVDFVRYGDLTVIPFPFKYLREWINLQTTTR
ncbi:hypothetical protein A9Q93_11080 [Nonlabens dokdonensis]|uniref:Uncharacterized protein n=1 Tax=Nonlabens dokdonensis TaxID=328515 RepID=A0A1Z8AMT7_9FLAO|nr:hypothetical protein [Nonlabens dokdonensis]OUS11654.1 hypothetical protein A9Q93_11080 [Nonlabens dokdonensis]